MTIGVSKVSSVHEPMIFNWIDVGGPAVRSRCGGHRIDRVAAIQGQCQHYLTGC